MVSFGNKVKFGSGLIIALLLLSGYNQMTSENDLTDEVLTLFYKPNSPSKFDLIVYVTNSSGNPIENVNVTIDKTGYSSTKFTGTGGFAEWKKLKKDWYNISITKFEYQNITETFYHGKKELRHYTLYYYDIFPPNYYNLSNNASFPIYYNSSRRIQFNCTWIDIDSQIDKVLFYMDYIAYPVNDNVSSEYYITISNLTEGYHKYYWFCNDSINNFNETPIESFQIIGKAPEVFGYLQLLPFLPNNQELESFYLGIIGLGIISGFGLITGLIVRLYNAERKLKKIRKELEKKKGKGYI